MVKRSSIKKTVQFGTDGHVETFELDSLKDHTLIWWTRKEVREIVDESETLIHFMNMNMSNKAGIVDSNQYPAEIDPNIHTLRGLEKRTEIGAWEVYEVQRDARNAVLNQQDKHRASNASTLSTAPTKVRGRNHHHRSNNTVNNNCRRCRRQLRKYTSLRH